MEKIRESQGMLQRKEKSIEILKKTLLGEAVSFIKFFSKFSTNVKVCNYLLGLKKVCFE